MKLELLRFLQIARGDEPADLALRNGRVINVFTGEIVETDVAIAGDTIVGLGADYEAKEKIDLGGRYVCPGLIDAHVHIESSMVTPPQFARAVVPRGTTTAITDPHEIANVAGTDGIRYMLDVSAGLPLTVYVNLPSCVPATHMGTAGAELTADDLIALADLPRVIGLAEFMNVPGAVLGLPGALEKLVAFRGRVIDGHAPAVSGKWLQAYAGAGPGSDHECMTPDEMLEKLRLGMYVFVRESTAAKNLRALLPAVTPSNARRCAFCTDDRHPSDLLDEGHVDYLIRLAVAQGLDPITAIRMATLNGAEWFRLHDRGAIAPGKRADLVVFSNLKDFHAEMVFAGGALVAQDGVPVGDWPTPTVDDSHVRDTVHVDWGRLDFAIPLPPSVPPNFGGEGAPPQSPPRLGGKDSPPPELGEGPGVGAAFPQSSLTLGGRRVRVIGVVPDQVITEHLVEPAKVEGGVAVADLERDLLKIAVIERHRGTGNVGLGFVRGLGLKRGALAGSVGHDAHNLVVAGCDDVSMLTAARAVGDLGGGLVAAAGDEVLAEVPLLIGGLMSDQPVETVRQQMDRLVKVAHDLGSSLHDPFMALGFLALEVIPALKLTDQGLVDVEKFDFVSLFADE